MLVAFRAGRRAPEQVPVLELVHPALAPGVAAQQAPGGEDRPAQRAELADRLHRVAGTGRVVAAARREGGGDPAPVDPNWGDQDRGQEPFHDKRSSSEESTSSASESRTPAAPSRSSRPSTPGL